jgi:uncharacterized protein (TIGR02246 family)
VTNDHGGPSANHSRDEAAVRALYQELMDGWNQGSGAAFASVFTEDGDLIGFDGTHFKGRQEIAPFHQQLFDKWLKGSRLVGEVKDVRFLSPDVALMHAVGGMVMRGKGEPTPERDSIQTLVATRQEGDQAASFARKSILGAPEGRKYPQTNGWVFWKYHDRETGNLGEIDVLRQRYLNGQSPS